MLLISNIIKMEDKEKSFAMLDAVQHYVPYILMEVVLLEWAWFEKTVSELVLVELIYL